MYAKIFSQIYDGTLCTNGPWQALVTFQQLLVLADQDGSVDMTAGAIARRTTIPLDIINLGIEELLKPDPESRTPAEEGRRLVPLVPDRPWGWRIVNYKHYRALKREEDRRDYHREYWRNNRSTKKVDQPAVSTQTQHAQPSQPIAEAKAEAEKDIVPTALVAKGDAYRVPNFPLQAIQDAYHEFCPSMSRVRIMTNMRQKHAKARWTEVCVKDKATEEEALDFFRWYFKRAEASDFLSGRRGGKDRAWKADFEWLMTAGNFAKVIEGKYHEVRT